MEDTVIFIGVEVFNSGNVFYFFPGVEMRKFFCRQTTIENNPFFKTTNIDILFILRQRKV